MAPVGALVRFLFDYGLGNSKGIELGLVFSSQSFLMPNIVGCFFMGIFIANTKRITSLSPLLYTALTFGFCGCLTTFSGWSHIFAINLETSKFFSIVAVFALEFSITWSFFMSGFACSNLFKYLFRKTLNFVTVRFNISNNEPATDIYGFAHVNGNVVQNDIETTGTNVTIKPTGTSAGPLETLTVPVKPAEEVSILWLILEQRIWLILFFSYIITVWVIVLIDVATPFIIDDVVRQALRTVGLAPAGAWTRYACKRLIIDTHIHKRYPKWNLATMLANLLGVLIYIILIEECSQWSWSKPFQVG